jgi:hypothetical protein
MAYRIQTLAVISSVFNQAQSLDEAIALFVKQQGYSSVEDAAEDECLTPEQFISSLRIDQLEDEAA